jgi:hypothetical protein
MRSSAHVGRLRRERFLVCLRPVMADALRSNLRKPPLLAMGMLWRVAAADGCAARPNLRAPACCFDAPIAKAARNRQFHDRKAVKGMSGDEGSACGSA